MLGRVSTFRESYRRVFADGTAGARLFDELCQTLAVIQHACVAQAERVGAIGSTGRMQARSALLQELAMVRATARAFAKPRPDLAEKFRQLGRPRDQQLLTIARAILDDIAPNEALFIEHHMPRTFLADLRGAIDRFEAVVSRGAALRSGHMSARATIELALKSATVTLRQLDAVVANALRKQPPAMAAWAKARRVPQRRGRRKQAKKAVRES